MANSPQMSLKLLVDTKGSRVLFAEVPKEFVDFLFQILSLPLGTLMEFIGSSNMIGSLGKLKDSIQGFPSNHFQPGIKTDDIFYPKTPFNSDVFLLSYDHSFPEDQSGASKAVYRCSKATHFCPKCGSYNIRPCQLNATLCPNSICPSCDDSMNIPMTVVMPPGKEVLERNEVGNNKSTGYVKDVVNYMVMDNLEVKPMSTISSITLINKFGVKDLSHFEEKTVSFGKEEGLKLLMASLKTKKVLTTTFMN